MIRSLYRPVAGELRTDLKPHEFPTALQDEGGLLWVDLEDEPADRCEPILRDIFAFHPLAIEDALHQSHIPKVDDWEEYLCIVLHAVSFEPSPGPRPEAGQRSVDSAELDLFVGPQYLVTYRSQEALPLAACGQLVSKTNGACERALRTCSTN